MRVWRLMTHHHDTEAALRWTLTHSKIAVGWGFVGDLDQKHYSSPDGISHAIRNYKAHLPRNSGDGGKSLWNFHKIMKKDDLVILNTRGPALVVQVDGPYKWEENENDIPAYPHHRRVIITQFDPREIWQAARPAISGESMRSTLFQCANPQRVNPLLNSS